LEQKKKGDLIVEGSNDVLSQALGTPEHSGRVRGVEGFVTPLTYFGHPKQRRLAITKAELLARDRERDLELQEAKKLLRDQEARMEQLINERMAEFEARILRGKDSVIQPSVTHVSDKGSHHDLSPLSSGEDEPDVQFEEEDDIMRVSPPSNKVLK
jgi:hypothetical protein